MIVVGIKSQKTVNKAATPTVGEKPSQSNETARKAVKNRKKAE